MKTKTIVRVFAVLLALMMMSSLLVACVDKNPGGGGGGGQGGGGGGQGGNKGYDSETVPLVMSTLELDGVFNPFYSTSGTDSGIWGMTQVSMIDTDAQGAVGVGGDRACLALAYKQDVVYNNEDEVINDKSYTDYTFVLKPNAKFSDGHSISVKDVLFGYYVNLDPVYTGSSTMYSTDILGLGEYRTQTPYNPAISDIDENSKMLQYQQEAENRADALSDAVYEILEDNFMTTTTQDKMVYDAAKDEYKLTSEVYNRLPSDELKKDYYDTAVTFYKELLTDYNSALSVSLEPSEGGTYPYPNITDNRQYFLYMEGYLQLDKDGDALPYLDEEGKVQNYNLNYALTLDQAGLIDLVFRDKMPGAFKDTVEQTSFYQIIHYWATGTTMQTQWTAEAKSKDLAGKNSVDHIYGITWNKQFQDSGKDSVTGNDYIKPACYDAEQDAVVINGATYPLAKYDANGNVESGFEVINIRIKKVDPKAIWNFAGSVVPMHAYSNAVTIDKWDGYSNFGVQYASTNFYDNVVKARTVPIGAGSYKAATENESIELSYSNFYRNNIVYYERNTYFYTMFCDQNGTVGSTENNAKIKYVRYKVVNANQIMNNLITGAIDYADPSATQANIRKVNDEANLNYTLVENNGYGYIGVNAGKPGLEAVQVRQAIMCAMDTTLVLNYYTGDLASNIWYPMSKVSWAYPHDGTTATSFRYAYDATGNSSRTLLEEAAKYYPSLYSYDGQTFNYKGGQLKLTFTIAGSTDDHPAYLTMKGAADLLNKLGLKVEVKNDSNTLKKLSNGELQVWAAAWGSAIDPDLYQVYHMDSNATSVRNWGYREIKKNKNLYSYEYSLMEQISEKIDAARETLEQDERTEIYADALDLILDLAVELPTYQRKNMFVYNTNKINVDTMVPSGQCTPYQSPLSFLWKVDYNH